MTNALFSLAGRAALVTGASSGLGRQFARALARAGATVALAARRTDRLDALAKEIKDGGGDAVAVAMDVTDPASIKPAFDKAQAALGPIKVLVNNAGVPSGSWFLKTDEDEWRTVLDVNLDGVFRVGQEAARRMKASGGGSIINIASIAGYMPLKTLAPYCTSKAAVIQLTKVMALELARDNIRVNGIAPGYFSTELNEAFLGSSAGQKLLSKVPFERAGRMEELDGPLLLLASDAGAFMTGTIVAVDGGLLLSS